MPNFFVTPWTAPARILCPWNFPGKNTGVGCHFLLQGIFPMQGSNLHLLHWQGDWILYDGATREAHLPHRSFVFSCCCCLVTQLCLTLCDPMHCRTPGFLVLHHLPELAQTHVHWVGDATQPPHPLSSPSPPTFILSQHQGLFSRVSSSHQVDKVLELQLQHQSLQWILSTKYDFL